MDFSFLIYKLVSRATGRAYIGCTKDLMTRINRHHLDLKKQVHHCEALQEHYNSYGWKDLFATVLTLEGNEGKAYRIEKEEIFKHVQSKEGCFNSACRNGNPNISLVRKVKSPNSVKWWTLYSRADTPFWYVRIVYEDNTVVKYSTKQTDKIKAKENTNRLISSGYYDRNRRKVRCSV